MEKSKDIYNDLIKISDILKKESGVSDVYIEEFLMFISICISNNLQLVYPFAEFNKLIDTVINNQKVKFFIMNQMNFKDNINKNILTIINFKHNYDKKLQDYFIQKMMEYFSHDVISTRIDIYDVSLRVNNNDSKYILNIDNRLDVLTVKKLFIKHQNLNIEPKNIIFYNNKNELYDNNCLIEYFISDENDIIDVKICKF
jgi:hypothetical protein